MSVGCIRHQSIVIGEDEGGRAALYFWSHKGPYRYGVNGVQYLGHDIENVIAVNLEATETTVHGVYHADKHQVWWWVATGAAALPDARVIFHTQLGQSMPDGTVRNGWARHTGASCAAQASVMFANTLGASMSRDLKPYVGLDSAGGLLKCDSTATADNGTTFQAYVDTREYLSPAGATGDVDVTDAYLLAKVATGVTITVTPRPSFGGGTATAGTALLTASGSETRLRVRLEGLQCASEDSVAYRVGDASAVSNAWELDALAVEHVSVGR